jgi:hypothetical protein
MTEDVLPWPEIDLEPDRAIAESQVFCGLRTVHLRRVDHKREYALVCDEIGLTFAVEVTGILSEYGAPSSHYRPNTALTNLRQTLDGEQGPVLSRFLRYSPWLITHVKVEQASLGPVLHGVMLARLLDLLVTLMEDKGLTAGRLREPYGLLLRTRFVILARLNEEQQREEAKRYLPELGLQVREAWRAWGQTMLQGPQEMGILLTRYGRSAEEEGKLLLFQPQGEVLWPFAAGEEDQPFTERLLTGWFLPRYDLARVMRVLSQLPDRSKPYESGTLLGRAYALTDRIRNRVAALMYWVITRLQVLLPLLAIIFLGFPAVFPQLVWRSRPLATIGWWVSVGLALLASAQIVFQGTRPLRYTLPRITLAIFVGYLALASSSEIMTFAIVAYEQYPPLAWAVALGSTIIALLAMYIEARRRLETRSQALSRAGQVLATAAARSLTLGWLILAPAGSLLLAGTGVVEQARCCDGWIGGLRIYPQLIFVLAPLALFVGIFVQTIWEEYPLTHPI